MQCFEYKQMQIKLIPKSLIGDYDTFNAEPKIDSSYDKQSS